MRSMTTAMQAALTSPYARPAIFIQATFKTGPIYVWTGVGSIAWGGNTWLGVGSLGSISAIESGANVEARGMVLALSGIDNALLTDVLTEFQTKAAVLVYFGLFDTSASTPTLVPDPISLGVFRMDQPKISVGAQTATISISCENRLIDMNVSVYRRYTNDDQQLDYPGDLGCEFVSGIQNTLNVWGRTPSSLNNT